MNMDYEEMDELAKTLATPIDFEKLIAEGIISKSGAWYILHKPNELPEHASRKMKTLTHSKEGVKVKFESHTRYEKMLRQV